MANKRISEAVGGVLATLLDADQMLVEKNSDSTDYHVTPAVMATYVFNKGGTLGAKLTAGAVEIEGSAFDINGGDISGVTKIAGDELEIDDININGKTISTTGSNNNIILTPHGTGEVVIAAGNLNYAGTAITATGAELNYVDNVASQIGGVEENQAVKQYAPSTTSILTGSGTYSASTVGSAIILTLPEISVEKSEELVIFFKTKDTGNITITKDGSDAGFVREDGSTVGTTIALDTVEEFVYLKSSGVLTGYWMIVGGYGYTLA